MTYGKCVTLSADDLKKASRKTLAGSFEKALPEMAKQSAGMVGNSWYPTARSTLRGEVKNNSLTKRKTKVQYRIEWQEYILKLFCT